MKRTLLLSLLTFVSIVPALQAQKKPITHELLWTMKRVGKPAVSPDGKWVVFSVGEAAYGEKKESSDLWIVAADGKSKPRRITFTDGAESDVTWSADSSRIAFAAKRNDDEVNQIYVLPTTAVGEASRVTKMPLAAGKPQFSPDGRWLAFSSEVYRGAADVAANRKRVAEEKETKSKVRIYDSFPVRQWDRWLDEKQMHLFVIAVDGGGEARDLLAGTSLTAAPGFSGRPAEQSSINLDAEWSPDSSSLVFNATTSRNTNAYRSGKTDLYAVAVAGGEPRQLTSGAIDYSYPQFRPDGKALCFKTNESEGRIYTLDRLACAPWPWNGTITPLTSTSDRSVGSFVFTPDSKTIYFDAEDSGLVKIYTLPVSGGAAKVAVEPSRGIYTALSMPAAGKTSVLVANWESSTNPPEVVRVDLIAKSHTPLTDFNAAAAEAIDWQPLRHFTFTNSLGRTVHNMIALPPNFDASRKYPLLVLIHGGAHNMWRDSITYRWNYHLLAAPGYVVLLTDYRGSTGYGEQFALDILRDPLKGPADDVNQGADEAIRRFPFIDGTRQAAAGASYGGHLVNWLEGTTTRYRALISHAGLANLESQWGSSDSIYHRELMIGTPPWEGNPLWTEQSPLKKAANFKTPILISVGENDFRVPLNQSLEMWSAVQRMRVPSRLLVWPDENHWIAKPENSKVFYREVEQWLARWINDPQPAP